MNARSSAVLYTPDILALAVALADFPYDEAHPQRGDAQSRVCGSRVGLGIETDEYGKITAIGARVSACAIGQASASLFLSAAIGRDTGSIAPALTQLESWLAGADTKPDWPGIAALAPARAYSARHQAILLPWRAAMAALSNPAGPD